jgi:hypothetical protein
MGLIVDLEVRAKRLTIFVDDGTAVVRCIKFLNPDVELEKSAASRKGGNSSVADGVQQPQTG